MGTVPLTYRSSPEFAAKTDELARYARMTRSEYVRKAVEEKNERTLAERIVFLSRTLSAKHLEINEEMNDSIGDGLAKR